MHGGLEWLDWMVDEADDEDADLPMAPTSLVLQASLREVQEARRRMGSGARPSRRRAPSMEPPAADTHRALG